MRIFFCFFLFLIFLLLPINILLSSEPILNLMLDNGSNAYTSSTLDYLYNKLQESPENFNEKEARHMVDVKVLFNWMKNIIAISIILVYLLWDKKSISISALLAIIFIVLLGILFYTSFHSTFHFVHELMYTNNDWIMNPSTDEMIRHFNQDFFAKVIFISCIGSLLFSIITMAINEVIKWNVIKKKI